MGCSSHHRLNHLRVSSASLRRVPDSAANNGTRHGQHRHVRPGAPLFGRRRLHGDRLHVRDRGLRVGELDVRRVAIGLLRHGVRRSRSEESLRTSSAVNLSEISFLSGVLLNGEGSTRRQDGSAGGRNSNRRLSEARRSQRLMAAMCTFLQAARKQSMQTQCMLADYK